MLTALACEHELFETRNNLDQDFSSKIPKSEQNPILRIDWSGEVSSALETPLVSTRYQGKMYKITDEKSHSGYSETSRWNREVFLLLSTLYTQLSLDPTTLPIQQLIQVNWQQRIWLTYDKKTGSRVSLGSLFFIGLKFVKIN